MKKIKANTIPLPDLSEYHQWMTSLITPPPFLYRFCQSIISGWLLYLSHHHSSGGPVRISSVDDFSPQVTSDLQDHHYSIGPVRVSSVDGFSPQDTSF
jgi:hypothetical protein